MITYNINIMKKTNIIKNERGIIILAIILSTLLVIAALAVFGVVSGRFGITYNLNNRIQAIRNAEAASYVAYQLMRENEWHTPAEETSDADGDGAAGDHTVTINGETVDITVSDNNDDEVNARVQY